MTERQAGERGDWFVAAGLFGTVALLLLWLVWRSFPFIERALALEDSPIAWVSSSLLVACAMTALLLAQQPALRPRDRTLWLLTSVLLLVAALDERFQFHETFKRWLFVRFFHGDAARMGHLGDLPMLLYPVAGLAIVAWCARSAARSRKWLLLALAVGSAAVALDIATERIGPQMIEEVLEVGAETAFLCGLVSALRSSWTR